MKTEPRRVRLGVDGHNLERVGWGTREFVRTLLSAASLPPLAGRVEMVAYFHSSLPQLAASLERSVTARPPWRLQAALGYGASYHVFMPIRAWLDGVDLLVLPNYMLPAIPITRTAVVLTNDLFHEMNSPDQGWVRRLGYKIFGSLAKRFATVILTFSNHSQHELITLHGVAARRVVVAPPGVDLRRFAVYQNPPVFPYVLSVGQILPRRHLPDCLAAFRMVRQKHPDLRFIVVGVDKHRPQRIARLVSQINREFGDIVVEHRQHVTDSELGGLYRAASLVIAVSEVEAFALPPFEAFLLGTPALVRDTPLAREIYGDHVFTINGAITPESIAAGICSGLSDHAKRALISQAGRDMARHHDFTVGCRRIVGIAEHISPRISSD